MQTLIEQTRTIIDIIRSEPQIPDELQESKTKTPLSLLGFETNCREALKREEQPFSEQQELLKLASVLYNECRMWLKKKRDAEPIVRIRFCACILLHISCFQAASSADLPMILLSSAPDIIRAYQHTARSMQDYSLGDLPFQCYQNAIALIDKIAPIIQNADTGRSSAIASFPPRILRFQRSRIRFTHGMGRHPALAAESRGASLFRDPRSCKGRLSALSTRPQGFLCKPDVGRIATLQRQIQLHRRTAQGQEMAGRPRMGVHADELFGEGDERSLHSYSREDHLSPRKRIHPIA